MRFPENLREKKVIFYYIGDMIFLKFFSDAEKSETSKTGVYFREAPPHFLQDFFYLA